MPKKIDPEKIKKIYEAHELRFSVDKAAGYAGVSYCTVLNYWKESGLKAYCNQKNPPLPQETIKKIIEAHDLKMSSREAGEYTGTSNRTVLDYWRKAGLKPHFRFKGENQKLSKKTVDKIFKAHKLKLSIEQAAEYANVCRHTVKRYWSESGLKSNYVYVQVGAKARLSELLDEVFDTVNNPNEELTLEQITERITYQHPVDQKDLQKKVNKLVKLGFYEVVEKDGVTYYKPGMPSAMDGMVR